MPRLRSLDLGAGGTAGVELCGYSIAAIAQLTALTRLSLGGLHPPHLQDLTRLTRLSSLEGFRLGCHLEPGRVLQVSKLPPVALVLVLFHPRTDLHGCIGCVIVAVLPCASPLPYPCFLVSWNLSLPSALRPQDQNIWQSVFNTIGALTTLRELALEVPGEADAALQLAIATWPQHLTNLAVLDLVQAPELGPAATTTLLYNMPSLTSLYCRSLSAPATQHTAVSQLRSLQVGSFSIELSLSVLAQIKLGPQCSLGLWCNGLVVYPGGAHEALLLRTAVRNSLRFCKGISMRAASDLGQPLGQEASERMVGALAAGLAGVEGGEMKSLGLRGFTLRRSSAAALVGLLQAAPRVNILEFQ